MPDSKKTAVEILHSHREKLWSIAKSKTKSDAEADDIVQRVFIEFWQKHHDRAIASAESFLRLAKMRTESRAIDSIRLDRRYQQLLVVLSKNQEFQLGSVGHETCCRVRSRLAERIEILCEALLSGEAVAGLTEKERTVLRLRWIDDLKPAEVASIMGIGVSTVSSHSDSAKKKLRPWLQPDYKPTKSSLGMSAFEDEPLNVTLMRVLSGMARALEDSMAV